MVPLTLFTLLYLDCSQEEGYRHEKFPRQEGETCGQESHCHEKGNDHQEKYRKEGRDQKDNDHQEEGHFKAVSLGRPCRVWIYISCCATSFGAVYLASQELAE
jgi:hypothetical protein